MVGEVRPRGRQMQKGQDDLSKHDEENEEAIARVRARYRCLGSGSALLIRRTDGDVCEQANEEDRLRRMQVHAIMLMEITTPVHPG